MTNLSAIVLAIMECRRLRHGRLEVTRIADVYYYDVCKDVGYQAYCRAKDTVQKHRLLFWLLRRWL